MSDQPGDESLPDGSPYAAYPGPLMETLRRSYRERTPGSWHLANGFNGKDESPKTKSFSQVLDGVGTACMEAILRVYRRASSYPNLWEQVWTIRNSWPPGTSEGFFFNTKTAPAMQQALRTSAGFCGDLPPGQSQHQTDEFHQTRQCYREMVRIGTPGLHVCIVTPGKADADGGAHNMHIDFHQLGKAKTKKCSCWYAGLNSHFSDVGGWIVDQFLDKLDEKLTTKARSLGPVSIPTMHMLSPGNRAAIRAWMLAKMLQGSDIFDVLEGSIDTPPPLPDDAFGKITTPLIWVTLREFKDWYMNNL
jgi:hypothetical protein